MIIIYVVPGIGTNTWNRFLSCKVGEKGFMPILMRHMLIFGLSYTSGRLASSLHATGWCVSATRRSAGPDAMTFDDREAVLKALAKATHILSSITPGTDGERGSASCRERVCPYVKITGVAVS